MRPLLGFISFAQIPTEAVQDLKAMRLQGHQVLNEDLEGEEVSKTSENKRKAGARFKGVELGEISRAEDKQCPLFLLWDCV
ncbi:MAG: hypothetical protein QXN82_03680 [Desulfurococcaceae archaeon]